MQEQDVISTSQASISSKEVALITHMLFKSCSACECGYCGLLLHVVIKSKQTDLNTAVKSTEFMIFFILELCKLDSMVEIRPDRTEST